MSDRSAHAAIRGYLYQASLTALRWLELGPGEVLVCEGDEDVDRILLADGVSGVSEQVKDLARLSPLDTPLRESIRNFVRGYHAVCRDGGERQFVFWTTAARQERLRGFDLVGRWSDLEDRPRVIAGVRDLCKADEAEAVAWLDGDAARWDAFVAAVTWEFGAPDLLTVRADLVARLGNGDGPPAVRTVGPADIRPDILPDILADRLVARVFEASARPARGLRELDRAALAETLETTREALIAWAASQQAEHVRAAFGDVVTTALEAHEAKRLAARLDDLLVSGEEPLRSADPPPGALLRAGSQVVSFHGREDDLALLDAMWDEDAPAHVCLVTATGGAGKTRLLVEWVRRLRLRGERAGFLPSDRTADHVDPLFEGTGRRAVVVDYAENRRAVVEPLLARLARHARPGLRLRVILLARGEEEWWTELQEDDAAITRLVAHDARTRALPPLLALDEREAAFREALADFAALRGPGGPAEAGAPDLAGDHFAHPLFVQMAALAALDGKTVSGADDLLAETLNHEQRYWWGALAGMGLSGTEAKAARRTLRRTLVLLTLHGGAPDQGAARALLRSVSRLPAGRFDLEDAVLDALSHFYACDGGLRGLEPDPLGEHLVAARLAISEDADLLDAAFAPDAAGGAPDAALRHALTVLDRIAARRHAARDWLARALRGRLARLADFALDGALETGDPIGAVLATVVEKEATAEQAAHLTNRCPEHTVVLRELAAAATGRVLRLRREAWPDPDESQRAELAGLSNNVGVRLGDLGRREDALSASSEAVEQYRVLASERPDAFLPDLAMSLNNLSIHLSALGRREDALSASSEAVEIRRVLASERPDAFLPDLASSLNKLGLDLSALGRLEDALSASSEAVEQYRVLASERPDAILPDLASSLNNLGAMLSALGRREDALSASSEAVEILRVLASERPDAFLPDLASSLNNLGIRLSALGRLEDALSASSEAVEILRFLASERPDAFLPDLASSLTNLGVRLSALGRLEDALSASSEAVEILRFLASERPDAFLPALASSLNNLGIRLSALGRREDALSASSEAVEIRRVLASERPDAFLPDLAMSLNNLGAMLSALGRREDALSASSEAVEILRFLASERPDAFLPDLASSLNNLGNRLSASGRREDALSASSEAVATLAPFFLRLPGAFDGWMATMVRTYATRCEEAGVEPDATLLSPVVTALAERANGGAGDT